MRRNYLALAHASPYGGWSPLALAHACGYRVDLRKERTGDRTPYLLGPTGRARPTDHGRAWLALSRLAARRGINPAEVPSNPTRALWDGQERGDLF